MDSSSKYFIDTSHNVVYLNGTYFDKFTTLQKRLVTISAECNVTHIDICGVYKECKSFFGMYYDIPVKGRNINDLLKREVESIVGCLLVVVFEDMNEIYNVCVASSARGKGIGTKLVESVINFSSSEKIWLGIDVKNPLWTVALNLYVKAGFLSPRAGNTTPHDTKTNIVFIGLTFEKGVDVTAEMKSDAIEKANVYRSRIVDKDTQKGCNVTLSLSSDLLYNLKERYLYEDKEYAGIFRVVCYDDGKGILGFPESSEISGESLEVGAPKGKFHIVYHSHPDICYRTAGCYLGWPSSTDMASSFINYMTRGQLLSVVITIEGVYAIQLTQDFQRLIKKLPHECLSKIHETIKAVFKKIDGQRKGSKLFKRIEEIHSTLIEYGKIVNSFSLHDIPLECIKQSDVDIKVFVVKFLNWQGIKEQNMEINLSYIRDDDKGLGCPLPIDATPEPTLGEEICDRMIVDL